MSIILAKSSKKEVPIHQGLLFILYKHALLARPSLSILVNEAQPNNQGNYPEDLPHMYSSESDKDDDIPIAQWLRNKVVPKTNTEPITAEKSSPKAKNSPHAHFNTNLLDPNDSSAVHSHVIHEFSCLKD